MNRKIKIFIADDDTLFIDLITQRLNGSRKIEIIGVADDGEKAFERIVALIPDIVILDLSMPKIDGIGILSKRNGVIDKIKFLVLTNSADQELIENAYELGASGYLIKRKTNFNEIVSAITWIATGKKYFKKHNDISELMKEFEFTESEAKVFQHLIHGRSSETISEIMEIKLDTIRYYRKMIYKKLDINSYSDLIIFAKTRALI